MGLRIGKQPVDQNSVSGIRNIGELRDIIPAEQVIEFVLPFCRRILAFVHDRISPSKPVPIQQTVAPTRAERNPIPAWEPGADIQPSKNSISSSRSAVSSWRPRLRRSIATVLITAKTPRPGTK